MFKLIGKEIITNLCSKYLLILTTFIFQVSYDNFLALKDFFVKFPEFVKNEFFITGESYGGIYVPTLSVRVLADSNINFKGMAIGNGISDFDTNENSLLYFAYYHGLIGDRFVLSLNFIYDD